MVRCAFHFCTNVPELRRRAAETLALLGASHIRLDAPVAALAMGERQLVEIARLLTRDARVLILDEPTATLTDVEIERIFAALLAVKREGRSVLYITHRLAEVYEICDQVTVLRNGELVATSPLRKLSRAALIEQMLGRPSGEMYPEETRARGAPALVVEGLSLPGSVDNFAMNVCRGEILCIAGQIGSGSAEIIAALAGLVHDASGRVTVNGRPLKLGSPARAARRGIMFVSGDRAAEGVFRRLSVLQNLVATRLRQHSILGFLRGGALRAAAGRLAKRVGVDRRRLRARAEELSGGNQQKLAFGRSIERRNGGVLLMNEPTRGIDVGARAEIYRLMRSFCEDGYALVMASSDLEEIVGLGDVVITLYRGRQVGLYRAQRSQHAPHRRRHHPSGRSGDMTDQGLAVAWREAWRLPLPSSRRGRVLVAIRVAALLALLIIVATTPGFFTAVSLFSLLNTTSFIGCVAIGMTFITLSGNIMSFALSVTLSTSGMVFISALPLGLPAALIIAFAYGGALTGFQGAVIGYFRANPIIVSMAALALITGGATLITQGQGIYPQGDAAAALKGRVLGIPMPLAAFILTVVAAQVVLSFTRFGRQLYMVGSNWRAALAAGLEPARVVLGAYVAAGLCTALAGILMAARYSSGDLELGLGYDYSAISAVLVGGTAISGGEGSAIRTLIGAFIIAVCQVLLLLHGFSPQIQYLAIGVIVLFVIMLQTLADSD